MRKDEMKRESEAKQTQSTQSPFGRWTESAKLHLFLCCPFFISLIRRALCIG